MGGSPPAYAMAVQPRGKAVMIWTGDWFTLPGASVQGMFAVRQVVQSQFAYAPEACRSQACTASWCSPSRDRKAGRAWP